MAESQPFTGFPAGGLRFLRTLGTKDIVARPKTTGSIAPINNDLRFNPGRSPYKDHLVLKFTGAELKRVPKPVQHPS